MKKAEKFSQVVPFFAAGLAVLTGIAIQSLVAGLVSFLIYYLAMSYLK